MLRDVRFALRMLLKSKVLTVTALLSLALGIGANTALFSVIDGLILRVLPVDRPDDLVLLNWGMGRYGWSMGSSGSIRTDASTGERIGDMFSFLAYRRFREQAVHADVFGFVQLGNWNVSLENQSHVATGQLISGNYHSALHVTAAKGRTMTEADDSPSADPVAVLSYSYWSRQLGFDLDIVGKTIYLNRVPLTVVGVTSPDFTGVKRRSGVPDVSIPMSMEPRIRPDSVRVNEPWTWWVMVMGRLKPGSGRSELQANLNPVFLEAAREGWETAPAERRNARLDRNEPRSPARLIVDSAATGFDNMANMMTPVLMLSVITGLVLLIVCANLANLLLAKSSARHREIALRLSMGASRWRLVRQLLTETVLMALAGGLLGLLVGYWAAALFENWINADGQTAVELQLNLWVLAATIATSLFTGILFGLAPALRATRVDLNDTLKETARSVGGNRSRLGKLLLVVQVAMSLVLLVGAGLFLSTLRNLQSADAGFDRKNLVWFTVNPQMNRYPEARIAGLYDRMIDAIHAIPGVRSATIAQVRLLSGSSWTSSVFKEGAAADTASSIAVHQLMVRPNFFETMEMRLILGRNLNEHDVKISPKVALINDAMARQYFAGTSPIGKRFKFGILPSAPYLEIVGVVSDAKYTQIQREVPATVYTSYLQETIGGMHFAVRTAMDPLTIVPQLTEAVRQVDKDLPLFDIKTQEQEVGETQNGVRAFAAACSFFGALALVLASIGLYGIMSFGVARRTNEIGIRIALGASGGSVVRMVMRESMILVAIGAIVGIVAALGVARLIASQLYGLEPHDPFTIAAAVALMLAVAGFAGYLPARGAARVDPMVALKYE